MKLHPRTLPVQAASLNVRKTLEEYSHANTESDAQMLATVAEICAGRVREACNLRGLDPHFDAVRDLLDRTLAGLDVELTGVEVTRVLLEYQTSLTKYLLRLERHPDDPDRKADEE